MPTESRFALAAAGCFLAGLAVQAAETAAALSGSAAPAWAPDAKHLLIVGTGGFLVGAAMLRAFPGLASDPEQKKGVAPRAFWILLVGVLVRATAGPSAEDWSFFAAAALAGVMMEIAAVGMLLYSATRLAPTT